MGRVTSVKFKHPPPPTPPRVSQPNLLSISSDDVNC